MTELPRKAAARTARLAALPLGYAGRQAVGFGKRLGGKPAEAVLSEVQQRTAEQLFRTLGELKGGAMKFGQALSVLEAALPDEVAAPYREHLTALQDSAPPMPTQTVREQIELSLGDAWREQLVWLDGAPAAAASIGQVHRGRWHDGRDVAVKVQYPGVREALAADIRTISVLSRAAALVARGLTMPPLVAELRDRLTEELDYLHEARIQRDMADGFRDDPDIVIPEVVHATSRVLVQDWIDGTPLAEVARSGDQATRDTAGDRYRLFLVSGPERAGWLHTDPHPGNFRLLDDGRLGVLDFGSALHLPGGLPPTFGRLLTALHDRDHAEIERRLRQEGFLLPGRSVDIGKLTDYMGPFTEPARHDRFHFSRAWLRREFGRINDPRNPDFAVALQLNVPAEHLFTHRVWLGLVGVLCQLDATIEVRSVLERWVTGFDPPPGA